MRKLPSAPGKYPTPTALIRYQTFNKRARDDDLIVRNLVQSATNLSDFDVTEIKRTALNEPLLLDSLIRTNSRVAGILVNVQLPGVAPTAENADVVGYTRKLASDVEALYLGTRIYLSGNIMMNNAFPEATSADLRLLIPLSFGVMIILLTWLVGDIVSTMAACLVFAFSIVGALGYAGYIGYPLTPVSASSPTIILTIAMANCIHVLVSFLFGRRHGLSKNEAIKESLPAAWQHRRNWRPYIAFFID